MPPMQLSNLHKDALFSILKFNDGSDLIKFSMVNNAFKNELDDKFWSMVLRRDFGMRTENSNKLTLIQKRKAYLRLGVLEENAPKKMKWLKENIFDAGLDYPVLYATELPEETDIKLRQKYFDEACALNNMELCRWLKHKDRGEQRVDQDLATIEETIEHGNYTRVNELSPTWMQEPCHFYNALRTGNIESLLQVLLQAMEPPNISLQNYGRLDKHCIVEGDIDLFQRVSILFPGMKSHYENASILFSTQRHEFLLWMLADPNGPQIQAQLQHYEEALDSALESGNELNIQYVMTTYNVKPTSIKHLEKVINSGNFEMFSKLYNALQPNAEETLQLMYAAASKGLLTVVEYLHQELKTKNPKIAQEFYRERLFDSSVESGSVQLVEWVVKMFDVRADKYTLDLAIQKYSPPLIKKIVEAKENEPLYVDLTPKHLGKLYDASRPSSSAIIDLVEKQLQARANRPGLNP
ncbi:MAG: hypothetical protein P4L65_09975 [Legionella sp.]|nr:hypothetical protein [Legionella sp.]